MHLGIIKITCNRTATHFMDDRFMILLWKYVSSESATVCFVIILSICYWLFLNAVIECYWMQSFARRVCVWERETGSHHSTSAILIVACVCVCVRERERDRVTSQRSVQPVKNHLNRGLCVWERERQGHITAECTARQKSS